MIQNIEFVIFSVNGFHGSVRAWNRNTLENMGIGIKHESSLPIDKCEDAVLGVLGYYEGVLGRDVPAGTAEEKPFCFAGLYVQPVYSAVGGDPEYSGFLLDYLADDVVRDAFLVSRFRLENGDALAVVHVKSVPGAEPHLAVRVLKNACDGAVRKSGAAGYSACVEILAGKS